MKKAFMKNTAAEPTTPKAPVSCIGKAAEKLEWSTPFTCRVLNVEEGNHSIIESCTGRYNYYANANPGQADEKEGWDL